MKVVPSPAGCNEDARRVCMAIGVFDGVHLGHQQVIRQAVDDAARNEGLSVVITFDRHPNSVVAPDRVPPTIYSLPQKLRALDGLGVDVTVLIPFKKDFSLLSGEQFVRGLAQDLGPIGSVSVGADFTFGHRRSGNVPLLEALGRQLGFEVHGLAAVALDGNVVSSTRIREGIASGQLVYASQMLGRVYSLAGTVVRGDHLGRQLGFPTANIEITGRIVPPNGVYAVHARVHGKTHRAVLNIGRRPTLSQPTPALRVEAHLLDFSGDLYDTDLEVTFVARLRDEQKFPSLESLKDQITVDIASACALFSKPIRA